LKFDVVVGNPPWIVLRSIENVEYQDFVKQQVLAYGLLESHQTHLYTQMEVATLFFCRVSDLYLKDSGVIAFVMPHSVLTGALHHVNFKKFKKPPMKLVKILDLKGVSPLFNVPSCVLIAIKSGETKYPVPIVKYKGKLPEKNIKLSEAVNYLNATEDMYSPPEFPATSTYSPYYGAFKEGATIVPRVFWFIDFEPHPILGVDASKPRIKTSEEALKNAKEPWKGIKLEGNIEANFIYTTILGKDLLPFGYVKLSPVVLPIEPKTSNFEVLDVEDLRKRGFTLMADWLEKAQKYWEERAGERSLDNFPRVIHRLNREKGLSSQNPSRR